MSAAATDSGVWQKWSIIEKKYISGCVEFSSTTLGVLMYVLIFLFGIYKYFRGPLGFPVAPRFPCAPRFYFPVAL